MKGRGIVLLVLAVLFLSVMTPRAASVTKIAVCQTGYSASQLKIAVAIVTGGNLSDSSFRVVKASDGSQVYSGSMTAHNPSGWTRGETYYKMDFSAFTTTGDYKIVTNGFTSRQFTIASNIWQNYLDEMLEYYRIQRCGTNTSTALPAGFTNRPGAEALHAACHMDDAKKGSETGANADMTGAWHDAGDNNKYQSNTGWVTGALAVSYLRHPSAGFDYDANGVPDLLDEARWGAENLLKIQAAAAAGGGVYDTIDAPNGQQYAWKYPTSETNGTRGDSDDRVGHTRSAANALTYDAAMKTAGSLAAVARAFASRDATFSNNCRTGAINAYNWALSHTSYTGGNYAIGDQNNARLWAAVELYRLTNDSAYGNWISSYVNGLSSISTAGTNYWGLQPIALAEYYPVAGSLQSKVVSLLAGAADNWRGSLTAPFGVQSLSGVTFGVNEPNICKAADAFRLYEINSDTAQRDAAIQAVQWTFGVNPFDLSFVCGIGAVYPNHLHSRLDADATGNANSTIKLPGYMACGAIWADTLNANSVHPWYEDRALANDGGNQWRYNEHSVSIQFGLVDLVVALAYGSGGGGPLPGGFNLSDPANGAIGVSTSPTLTWTASSDAASYTLVVDDNGDYASPIYNQDVGNVTAKQVTGLAGSTTYYWKVTAHNANGDTPAANNSLNFTTQASTNPPGGFNLTSPANGATGVATNPTLSWGASSGATSYTLVVDDQSDYASPVFNQDVGNVTAKQLTGLANSTTYYWKVTAHNTYGDTAAANNSFSFTTSAPGQTMEAENMALTNYVVNTNSSASGGNLIKLSASGVTGNAAFNFASSTGTYDIKVYYFDENDGSCTFNVYVAGVNVDTWVANQNLGSADPVAATRTSRTISGVTIANGAQIKLEAVQNSQEWGRFDNVEITSAAPPPPPGSFNLSSPASGATGLAVNPTLSWGSSSGAASYTLVVDDNSDYASPIFNQDVGNVTAKQVTGLANSTTYYWKVTAHNAAGDTAASNNSFSVTTAAATSGQAVEAESMTLTNYTVNTNSYASGGSLIKLSGSGMTGTAVFNATSGTGTYDIKVYYFDENDGACTLRVYMAGTVVDQWTANQNLGSADPVAATRTSRTISGVTIPNGAQIKLEAVQNAQEWGRFDNVEITAATPPAEQVIPAESGTLAGGATVTSSANAENGQYIGNMHLSGASDTISGVDGGASGGSYTLTIRYAANDTNPTLDLYVNGTFVRTLTFTNTGGWETFAGTSTGITLNAGTGNTIMLKHNTTNTGGVNLDTLRVQ